MVGEILERFADIVGAKDSLVLGAFRNGTAEQKGLAAIADKALRNHVFTGMDSVPPETYLEWWKDHGARVGRIVGKRVQWAISTAAEA